MTERTTSIAGVVAGIAGTAALLALALWNGFPFIFPDTGGYLERPFAGTLELGRSALYGAFLAAGMTLDFWPNVVVQSSMMVWLVFLTLRTHGLGGRPWLAFGITLLLACATSLPIYAGQLMPDVLFPAAALALYLLAFRVGELARSECFALAVMVALAIAMHMATLALAVGMLAAFVLLARTEFFSKPRLGWAAAAVACGIALCPLSNAAITGKFAFTPGGTNFLFQRLLQDGIVTRYLDAECPDPSLRICAYRGELSQGLDDWLWKNDTPFWKLGGWQEHSEEERRIILATLWRYPLSHITTAATASVKQLFAFGSEIVTSPWDNSRAIESIVALAPMLGPRLMAARQQTLSIDAAALNTVHIPFGALSMIGVILAVIFGARFGVTAQARALCLSVLVTIAVNAAICGVFSQAGDRYQSRLMALAPLALMIALLRRQRRLGNNV